MIATEAASVANYFIGEKEAFSRIVVVALWVAGSYELSSLLYSSAATSPAKYAVAALEIYRFFAIVIGTETETSVLLWSSF